MAKKKIISLILCIAMMTAMFPCAGFATDDQETMRTVYLHAQGENPTETTNNSTVYMGDIADVYFAIDDPNKGDYDAQTDTHLEPQYDLNGYTLRICYDPEYFNIAENTTGTLIDYTVPDAKFGTSDTDDEEIGDDTGVDVPQTVGYFVYKQGEGTYTLGEDTFNTVFITVFYSGGYVPQKEEGTLWYNLAKLSLTPKKTGSTSVFMDVDSGNENYMLELFAKNKSDALEDQTFDYNAINGGWHHISIKEKLKPTPPIAKPTSGGYVENVTVALTAEKDCIIYYTIDDTDPISSPTRIEYTDPIDINISTEIKTCAYRGSDDKYSNTVSYEYTILPDRPYLFYENKDLLPDIYSDDSPYIVYVSDKNVFRNIADGSEVYYTFSETADAKNPVIGSDPETQWVQVLKGSPFIYIDKNRVVRLITDKMGEYSEPAWYYLSIKPAPVVANYESGVYDTKIDVTLTTETPNAAIYYTIDGSDPKSSDTRMEYIGDPIAISQDTTLRAVAYYDGEWSDKSSYCYVFNFYNEGGVSAFYPSGVYDGSVEVTLIPNNPDCVVEYHTGDGQWKDYTDDFVVDRDTTIIARPVIRDDEGNVISTGEEYTFVYKIKPLPPAFAPESTQFTSVDNVTIYTPESTAQTTERYALYYTLDGTNPKTSNSRIHADAISDSAIVTITGYTVISAVVLKDGETYSDVVTHTYDVVMSKPGKPVATLVSGHYTREIGSEGYTTQFVPVPEGTQIYYTVCYDGELCPDPIPNTENTYLYDPASEIDVKGVTVIKAVAVNGGGTKSNVAIFYYVITPEAPVAAPSASISGDRLPVVPVDSVLGGKVKYTIGDFTNEFVNDSDERFYIDTQTGNAYRDKECTQRLGTENTGAENSDSATLVISAELDGVESDKNTYIYSLVDPNGPGGGSGDGGGDGSGGGSGDGTGDGSGETVLAPPYADKASGTYEERKIDEENNLLAVKLYSINTGGEIQYKKITDIVTDTDTDTDTDIDTGEDTDPDAGWTVYTDGTSLLLKEDTVLYLRYKKGENYSAVVSYVYNFVPLAPIIELPSGTYLKNDNPQTKIVYDDNAPTDKNYNIWYRTSDPSAIKDLRYGGGLLTFTKSISVKAYVLNEDTGKVSENTIHYYIIKSDEATNGSVYIKYPYDAERISAHLLGKGEYAEGIKLTSDNKRAYIYYYYTYTRKSDGQTVTTNTIMYDENNPTIPTSLMDDITIYAWLEDGIRKIEGSDSIFYIDFIHLNVPTTSLEGTGKTEFPKGTKYTLINEYAEDPNIILYYTLDGSDPADSDNGNRIAYAGETLVLNKTTTVKAVYYSACGNCENCLEGDITTCRNKVYGETGVYRYTVINSGGGGIGGGVIDKTRKYTIDIFGNEHPTHIGYIKGYPDGSVQPEGDITREEIAVILYRVTNHQYEKPIIATGEVFPDVALGRWSVGEIEHMTEENIISGYPDGEFKPARSLSRAEFAALICRFTYIKESEKGNPFTDLDETHWAYNEILALSEAGLIQGYEDSTFMPEQNITRAEVMTVMNKILGRMPMESYVRELIFNPYNDLYEDKWYYVTVLEATITHNYWLDNTGYEYKWEDWK